MVRLAPAPRPLDWAIAATVAVLVGSGVYSLTVGAPNGAWVFDVHAIAGIALVPLLAWKLARVAPRVRPDRLTAPRLLSILLALTTIAALATGVWWVFGGSLRVGPWGLLMVHMALGTATAVVLLAHLLFRYHAPGAADPDRRDALRYAAIVGAAAVVWRGQTVANRLLDTAGADRRFTGSREDGSDAGNDFPVTSWVADDPEPVDPDAWALDVTGRVDHPRSFAIDEVGPADDRRALLDCTSGWYSEHDWQGVTVGALLDAVEPDERARWVQFRSVTGYRWSLPIEEARDALLATHVDGDRLSHGHGFPLRLVAPDRRGFQWVKWIEGVRITRHRDPGEWIAIFVSGLDE
jgi:DMSO/TMAO reductase YedYZ molybdopterin-dependent catalytic subunit